MIRQITSKTFGYIAIIALVTVALFVLTMDVMKYVFDIDVAPTETDESQRTKIKIRRATPIMIQLIYVDHPGPT